MIAAFFASSDAMILLTAVLVSASCALLGCFLVLRGSSMLTDAISHSIVFGIVMVWMVTGLTSGPFVVIGAAAAGVLTVLLSEALAKTKRVQIDAAIGLVFPALFAAGVLMINLFGRDLHLDVDSVLLGEIGFVWLETTPVLGVEIPVSVMTLFVMLLVNLSFVVLLWKELKLSTFDAGLAAALGFSPVLLSHLLLGLTSATAVAAFDAVGAILFIAFIITPPATALLVTTSLGPMVVLSVVIGVVSSFTGYSLALRWDVSIGGMMAVMTGLVFLITLILAPQRGLIAHWAHGRRRLTETACQVLVAHLHSHAAGPNVDEENAVTALTSHLQWSRTQAGRVVLMGLDQGLIRRDGRLLALTPLGRAMAENHATPDKSNF